MNFTSPIATGVVLALLTLSSEGLAAATGASPRVLTPAPSRGPVFLGRLVPVENTAQAQVEAVELGLVLESARGESEAEYVKLIESFIAERPHSAWTPSLRAGLARHYQRRGFYTAALEHWELAWEAVKDSPERRVKGLADEVFADWTRALVCLGRVEMVDRLLRETAERKFAAGAAMRVMNTREAQARVLKAGARGPYCGEVALEQVARRLSGGRGNRLGVGPGVESAWTLRALEQRARAQGLGLVGAVRVEGEAIPVPSVMHLKQNHFVAVLGERGGRYEVADPPFGGNRYWSAEAIAAEASGYYLMPRGQVDGGWRELEAGQMEGIVGRGFIVFGDGEDSWLAAGMRRMINCENGMPGWRVSEPYQNLWLEDQPSRYQPALGEAVGLELQFKLRQETWEYYGGYGFGHQWNSTWRSFIFGGTDFPVYTDRVEVHLPGGGISEFIFGTGQTNSFNYGNNCRLSYSTDGQGNAAQYILTAPDRTQYVYEVLPELWYEFWVVRRVDAQGYVTQFGYDVDPYWGWLRLRTVVDADGRTNQLDYANQDWPVFVTEVTDPDGRQVSLAYDGEGNLTNVTDAASLSAGFGYALQYDNLTLTLTTPYGTNRFETWWEGGLDLGRWIEVREADGGRQVYAYYGSCGWMSNTPPAGTIPTGTPVATFDTNSYAYRNSFHWNAQQAAGLPAGLGDFEASDYLRGRMRHWLRPNTGYDENPDATLGYEREPTPDGSSEGPLRWYCYAGQINGGAYRGTQVLPAVEAQVAPYVQGDGTLTTGSDYAYYERNSWGKPTLVTRTYGNSSPPATRTLSYTYDATDGLDLEEERGASSQLVRAYSYNSAHQLLTLSEYPTSSSTPVYTTTNSYDGLGRLAGVSRPTGWVTTNLYYATNDASVADRGRLHYAMDLVSGAPVRTNAFTWSQGWVRTHTDGRGLSLTYTNDALGRLVRVDYPDSTWVEHSYSLASGQGFNNTGNALAIVERTGSRDRLGNWSHTAYDRLRRVVAETDGRTNQTLYAYCGCGSPETVTNALGQATSYLYDYAGRRTATVYPDASVAYAGYDGTGRLGWTQDRAGNFRVHGYTVHGLLTVVSNAYGVAQWREYDAEDRPSVVVDGAGVTHTLTYDNLGRVERRVQSGGGTNTYGYSAAGLVGQTNALGDFVQYGYDALGRKTNEVQGTGSTALLTNQFSYMPAGDLRTLTDGKGQVTTWNHDVEGRVASKVDADGQTNQVYGYNANGWLSWRWSAEKGTNVYSYDAVGNLTGIDYPVSTDVSLAYDALNRVTNQVDAAGTTVYAYTSDGQLWSENGPLASNDVVSYTWTNGQLRGLSFQQSGGGNWTATNSYDYANRLEQISAPSGVFTYEYPLAGSSLVGKLTLPSNAYVTNQYDGLARLTNTTLNPASGSAINVHAYDYNLDDQRTNQVRYDSSYVRYGYDGLGQLRSGRGYDSGGTPISTEQMGYLYDAAQNLSQRTNNGSVTAFPVNVLNQLTNGYAYDRNGNLTNAASEALVCEYDDENQLVTATVDDAYQTRLTYDARGRMRQRREYGWSGGWVLTDTVDYVYDGWRVLETRSTAEGVTTYTRGVDLSGTFEGAGGIGGLLARTTTNGTSFYHADGNGNITCLIDNASTPSVLARYTYDPYGKVVSQSGSLATANVYRFSSKEYLTTPGLYYYGYRFYDPNLQRWLNRDPLGEAGGINLYRFANNDAVDVIDPSGLWGIQIGCFNFGWGDPTYLFNREVWEETKESWHTGLDVIGTIEPTPIADGLNGLLYALEGDWSNVGISAVGMVSYLGDSAKLVRYGAKGYRSAKRATELHHLLPQSKNLAPFFKRAGLNIEDYRIALDKANHRLLPDGIHTGPSAENWNGVWKQFFDANPNANKQAILDQLAKMRKEYGI